MRATLVVAVLTLLLAQLIDGRAAVGLGVLALLLWALSAPMRRIGAMAVAFDRAGPGEVGYNIGWDVIVRQVFRVHNFDRDGTVIDSKGNVKPKGLLKPYGYLLVESPVMAEFRKPEATILPDLPIRLPVNHRDDFRLAASVFDEERVAAALERHETELLVTYAPQHVGPKGLGVGISHVLHFVIAPPGTLEEYYSEHPRTDPMPEQLFGEFKYSGETRVDQIGEPIASAADSSDQVAEGEELPEARQKFLDDVMDAIHKKSVAGTKEGDEAQPNPVEAAAVGPFVLKIPKVNAETTATIDEWLVKVGQSITKYELLVRVRWGDLVTEIPTPVAGRVAWITSERDDVPVGNPIAVIE